MVLTFQAVLLVLACQGRFLANARLIGDGVVELADSGFNTELGTEDFKCNICGEGGVITISDGIINTAEAFGTCLVVSESDLRPAFCEDLQKSSLIAEECGCVNTEQLCSICGEGGTITNPGGFVITEDVTATCGVLDVNQRTIPDCSALRDSSLVAEECGCVNPEQLCPVCGANGVLTNPDGLITTLEVFGTCGVINDNQRTIPADFCPILQNSALIAEECGCVDELTQSCPLCPPETPFITQPDALLNVTGIDGTCSLLNVNQRVIPDDLCPEFQDEAFETCGCSATSLAPTPSPVFATPQPSGGDEGDDDEDDDDGSGKDKGKDKKDNSKKSRSSSSKDKDSRSSSSKDKDEGKDKKGKRRV